MKIKAYIYAIALAAMMGGYCSLLPYNSALAQTSSKNSAEKSEKSTGSSAGGGEAQSTMHERAQKGAPTTGGKAMGRHQMVGTVKDIDSQKGIVDLKTSEGDLKLHFPSKSLADIKKGDQIQVQLSFSKQ